MSTFYGASLPNSIPPSCKHVNNFPKRQAQSDNDEEAGAVRGGGALARSALGINTDNSSSLLSQRFQLLHHVRKLLHKERVSGCFYRRISKNQPVDVFLNKTRNKANFGNIQRCANPWACPVCASIISEGRKNEVKQAMDWWKQQGGSVLLMTLTVPHYSSTDIKQLKKDVQKAYGYLMKGTRKSQELFKKYGIEHYISAFEVTFGQNGAHPHFHILLFVRDSVTNPKESAMRLEFYEEWANSCAKARLDEPSYEHGLDLQDGSYADKYVNKWGLEHEMTKSYMKKGKTDSKTPFDLIRAFAATGDKEAARLFQLYYYTFKGSRQLNWSRSLKKSSNTQEQSDQEIIDQTDNIAEMVMQLDPELWHPIRKHGKQGEFLVLVQQDHSLKLALDFVRQCLMDEGLLRQTER